MKITVFSVRAAALGLACLLACSLAVAVSPAGAEVPDPIVTGPIPANAPPGDPSHDYPLLATALDLAAAKNQQVSSTRSGYTPATNGCALLGSARSRP